MQQLREVLADLMAVDELSDAQAIKARVIVARTNLRQVIQQMGLPTARVVGLGESKEVKV
jgi:hypothetical protein